MVVGGRGEVDGGREGMGIRGRREEGGVAENIAKNHMLCVRFQIYTIHRCYTALKKR